MWGFAVDLHNLIHSNIEEASPKRAQAVVEAQNLANFAWSRVFVKSIKELVNMLSQNITALYTCAMCS